MCIRDGTLNGWQVVFINSVASHNNGWQVGVFNYSTDTAAHKIGLVNINPKTRIDFMAFLGTSSIFNSALRYRNRSTYNMIGVGTHYMGLDHKFSGAVFYRLGQYFNLSLIHIPEPTRQAAISYAVSYSK